MAKTQKLRERLEEDQFAKQDLVDIITLPQDQASASIDAREEQRMSERLKVDVERTWTKRFLAGSALGLGGAIAVGAAGYGGVAVALGMGSMISFAAGGAFAAGASDSRALSYQVQDSRDRKELLSEIQSDPYLTGHLSKKKEWLNENKAPNTKLPPQKTSGDSVLSKIKGGASVAFKAPQILATPLVNALESPKNLAEEALNEANATSAFAIGTGALAGAGVGAVGMLLQPGASPIAKGIFTVAFGVLGGAIGGMTGMIGAQAVNGLSTPLNVGRETQTKLGEGEHSLWDQYSTGVGLAAKAAFEIGNS